MDLLTSALDAVLMIEDVTRLDLEYAPPFNSVWDPVQAAVTALLRRGMDGRSTPGP